MTLKTGAEVACVKTSEENRKCVGMYVCAGKEVMPACWGPKKEPSCGGACVCEGLPPSHRRPGVGFARGH